MDYIVKIKKNCFYKSLYEFPLEFCLDLQSKTPQLNFDKMTETQNNHLELVQPNSPNQIIEQKYDEQTPKPSNLIQIQAVKSSQKMQEKIKSESLKKNRKIVTYKCKYCKTAGKKSSVIMCSKCKFYFHKQCLDPQKATSITKGFICEICQTKPELIKQQVSKLTGKSKKNKPLQKIESTQKLCYAVNRQKSISDMSQLMSLYSISLQREQKKRLLYMFYKKYPYYFKQNHLTFPIQDKLLVIYQSLIPNQYKSTSNRPQITYDNIIPQQVYYMILEIEVFFQNFIEDLRMADFLNMKVQINHWRNQHFKRYHLYQSFQKQGMDLMFSKILQLLLILYLTDIMDRNKVQNIKFIGLNAFFNLLTIINEDQKMSRQFIFQCSSVIIQNLTRVPSFKQSLNVQTQINQKHTTKQHKFYDKLKQVNIKCKQKLQIIIKLIRGLCDVDCFKQILMKKSQIMSQYTRQKGQLLNSLKSIQAHNIQLKQKLKSTQQEQKSINPGDSKQKIKIKDLLNKQINKIHQQRLTNQHKIDQTKLIIKQITKKIPFVNSLMKFLGCDRFQSQYFFYNTQPNKIHVKYKKTFLQQNDQQIYGYYQSKQQIQALKSWLNPKGINQKNVLFNIANLEQKQIFDFNFATLDQQKLTNQTIKTQTYQQNIEFSLIKRQDIIKRLLVCQSLYQQLIKQKQSILQRQNQLKPLFQKMNFQSKQIQTNLQTVQNQTKDQLSIWQLFFSKYSQKIWNWNQKVKKFWFQFLEQFSNDTSNQANLLILVRVFEITIKIYHNQTSKKLQRLQKKKQKYRLQKEQQIDNLNKVISSQDQAIESSETQNRRYLRKRAKNQILVQKQSDQLDQLILSSKIQSSNVEQPTSQYFTEKLKKSKNHKQIRIKRQKQDHQKSKENYNYKQKQKQKKTQLNDQSSKIQSNLSNLKESQIKQQSPQQQEQDQFCQVCFQNIFFNKQAKRTKFVRCFTCTRVYHKKCLQKDQRKKAKHQDQWNCQLCLFQNGGKYQNAPQNQNAPQQQNAPQYQLLNLNRLSSIKEDKKTSKVEQKQEKKKRKQKKKQKQQQYQDIPKRVLRKKITKKQIIQQTNSQSQQNYSPSI